VPFQRLQLEGMRPERDPTSILERFRGLPFPFLWKDLGLATLEKY